MNCGKEYIFKSDDFIIHKDYYGENAKKGYYSKAHCDCHYISSFQWRTIEILIQYGINYRAEIKFNDLYGVSGNHKLRYDFALLDSKGNIKYLIECQGQQHFESIAKFGGDNALSIQIKNDNIKREYLPFRISGSANHHCIIISCMNS